MFGVVNRARQNWEGVLYAIVTVFLLERVRTGWNRIERAGSKNDVATIAIRRRQYGLLIKASLLYALPLLLPVVKYIYGSIEELSWSVPGLLVLKNTGAFFTVLVLAEVLLAVVVYNLLRVYIERMNSAVGFFRKLGRNVWDGSVQVVQAGVRAGVQAGARAGSSFRSRVTDKIAASSAKAWSQSKGLALQTRAAATMAPRVAWCRMRRSWRKGYRNIGLQRTHS